MVDKSKFAEEEARGYRLDIIGRHVQVTEGMKNYVIEKLAKIEKFHTHILDIRVTMDVNKVDNIVVILLKFNHFKIKVQADSTDMYASIDKAIDKLQHCLRIWKDRIQEHNKKGVKAIDMVVNVVRRPYNELDEFNREIEMANKSDQSFVPHKIVGTKTKALKMLTNDEAVMKMELSGDHFLIFKGEEDLKLKVIYRRADNDYGIIQAE